MLALILAPLGLSLPALAIDIYLIKLAEDGLFDTPLTDGSQAIQWLKYFLQAQIDVTSSIEGYIRDKLRWHIDSLLGPLSFDSVIAGIQTLMSEGVKASVAALYWLSGIL